jgi:DNA-binding transcriptional regulator YiaG
MKDDAQTIKNLRMSRRKNIIGQKSDPYFFPFPELTLKDLRLGLLLSQKAMAETLEISLGHYQKYEQGIIPPPSRIMFAALMIYQYFGLYSKPEKLNLRKRVRNNIFGTEYLTHKTK